MATTTSAAAPLPTKQDPDNPPPYIKTHSAPRSTTGILDYTHLHSLSAVQLSQFDAELVAHARTWMTLPRINGDPRAEFRDWLRGYGFFVSWDPMKYRRRAMEEGRPLGERAACWVACAVLGEGGAAGVQVAFWRTLGELLEVRGVAGGV